MCQLCRRAVDIIRYDWFLLPIPLAWKHSVKLESNIPQKLKMRPVCSLHADVSLHKDYVKYPSVRMKSGLDSLLQSWILLPKDILESLLNEGNLTKGRLDVCHRAPLSFWYCKNSWQMQLCMGSAEWHYSGRRSIQCCRLTGVQHCFHKAIEVSCAGSNANQRCWPVLSPSWWDLLAGNGYFFKCPTHPPEAGITMVEESI